MNQLDLWDGGQQLNRGSKYIENNKYNNENSKLLCVVCNEIQIKSKKIKHTNYLKLFLKIIHYVICIIYKILLLHTLINILIMD